MEVIPAIDIRDGKCVRLYQGDYARETVYSEDPVRVAEQWVALGADRLHLVDLDGARDGAPSNLGVVESIAAMGKASLQLGGGIRTLHWAKAAVSIGVDRVIVGTAVIENPGFLAELCASLGPEAVVASVDARNGYVAVRGWTESTQVPVADAVERAESAGVRRFIYTDVARDGTLSEPNFHAIEALLRQTDVALLAAGGISSVAHLERLARIGVEAAIVGKAMYTGDVDLAQAIEAVSGLR